MSEKRCVLKAAFKPACVIAEFVARCVSGSWMPPVLKRPPIVGKNGLNGVRANGETNGLFELCGRNMVLGKTFMVRGVMKPLAGNWTPGND